MILIALKSTLNLLNQIKKPLLILKLIDIKQIIHQIIRIIKLIILLLRLKG